MCKYVPDGLSMKSFCKISINKINITLLGYNGILEFSQRVIRWKKNIRFPGIHGKLNLMELFHVALTLAIVGLLIKFSLRAFLYIGPKGLPISPTQTSNSKVMSAFENDFMKLV